MRIAITFGRFNIIHNGHLNLVREMARTNDLVMVGISRRTRDQRVIHVFNNYFADQHNISFFYCTTAFDIGGLDDEDVTVYTGSDRIDLAQGLLRYHPSWNIHVVGRSETDPSSTRCRQLFSIGAQPQEYIDEGLADTILQALIIIGQCSLEVYSND